MLAIEASSVLHKPYHEHTHSKENKHLLSFILSMMFEIHGVPLSIKNTIVTGLMRKVSILNLEKYSVFQLLSNSLLHKGFITRFCFVCFQEEKEMTSRLSNFRIRETNLLAYTPSYPPTHGAPVDAAPLKLLSQIYISANFVFYILSHQTASNTYHMIQTKLFKFVQQYR